MLNDIRTQIPECPLEYEVPHIPGSHTALVIKINAADIDWQERMLPWTLAGLINNTDLIMKGVHLYILLSEDFTQDLTDRIYTALKRIDLPRRDSKRPFDTILGTQKGDTDPLTLFGEHGYAYDSVCLFDINYWAFRGIGKAQDRADIKLPLGHVLRHTWGWAVAAYSFHIANDLHLKDTWVRMSSVGRPSAGFQPPEGNDLAHRRRNEQDPRPTDEPLHLTRGDSLQQHKKLAGALIDASDRAKWLHAANTAVYGEDYKKHNRNVAAYFLNEVEPNWHLDASILHYSAREVNTYFTEWAAEWQHLGTEALIALYLLKSGQHAYNLSNSLTIEPNYIRAEYPRLCNMRFADMDQFRCATRELMGAHMSLNLEKLS